MLHEELDNQLKNPPSVSKALTEDKSWALRDIYSVPGSVSQLVGRLDQNLYVYMVSLCLQALRPRHSRLART